MKTNRYLLLALTAAFAAASLAAQSVKVLDGRIHQTGAHGSGGGGGAGKVHVHDISIAPLGNTILAFPPQFQGGVRVAVGDLDGATMARLLKSAASPANGGGSFQITFDRPIDPDSANKLRSANNLRQLGLGSHNIAELQMGLLRADGPGQMREYATLRLANVTIKLGSAPGPARDGSSAQRSPVRSLTVTFSGLEAAPTAIGAASGGVWKTANFLDPHTGETRIGLLLPAVQKIR